MKESLIEVEKNEIIENFQDNYPEIYAQTMSNCVFPDNMSLITVSVITEGTEQING